MPTLTISPASKPPSVARGFPITVEYTTTTTAAGAKAQIAVKFPKGKLSNVSSALTRFPSMSHVNLKTDKANLGEEKIVDLVGEKGGELPVKDLGPQ
ncbi:hypothetical protein C0995_004475 [Termitomyces sp. Mi166|nr:hypothetical protein C0995_004475 [Termitomyces sp. Mi166\